MRIIFRNKKNSIFAIFSLSLILSLCIFCQKEPQLDHRTILIVDDEKISLTEFRNFYQLNPTFPGYKKGTSGVKEYVEKLTDRVLAEKLAKQEELFEQEPYKSIHQYLKKEEIIKAFYQKEIEDQIEVTEDELREAFKKMSVQLKVKHLFAPDKPNADQIHAALERGVAFDSLAKGVFADVNPKIGGANLGEVSWGDLAPELENVAFNLPTNTYSSPVKSRWGYHILLVTDRKQNPLLTEQDFQKKKSQIYKKLKRRKEQIEAGRYLKAFLDPFQIKVKKEAFLTILSALGIEEGKQHRYKFNQFQPISNEQIEQIRSTLQNNLDQPFMISLNANWSVEDFLSKLGETPRTYRPQLSSPEKFKEDIGIMIRNEFLVQKAKENGIHQTAVVDSAIRYQARNLAYQHYLEKKYENYEYPAEVKKFYQQKKTRQTIEIEPPSGILVGMKNLENYRRYYASRELHQFLLDKFPDVKIKINHNLIEKEAKNINWDKPVRMFVAPTN